MPAPSAGGLLMLQEVLGHVRRVGRLVRAEVRWALGLEQVPYCTTLAEAMRARLLVADPLCA
jgi:hypothetical protein